MIGRSTVVRNLETGQLKNLTKTEMDSDDQVRHNTTHNPFISRIKLSEIQKLKVVVCGILLPLRAGLMLILIVFGSLVGFICNLGVGEKQEPEPYTGYRKLGQKLLSKLARILAFVMGYHNVRIKGQLASSEEAPVIVVAPHLSFMDGIFTAVIGNLTYISRKENVDVPLFGHMVKLIQPITVKRGERSFREEAFKEILRRAKAKGVWPNICVFPEGTCTNGQSLITFKPGAFLAGVPVQPVLFKYPKDAVAWTWIAPSTIKQLTYILTRFNNPFEIEFLPVYKPSQEEQNNAILYANNVRTVMAKALGIPTSDHSFEDCSLMLEASLKGLPVESAIVEYYKISTELGLNLEKLKNYFERFAIIDKNKDGLITFDEFSRHLSDIGADRARSIFTKIDEEKRGFIDFRSFVYGLSKNEFTIEEDLL